MKKLIYILCFLGFNAHGQLTPIISQYMFNDVALNPANTGNQESLSLFADFRAQWVGINGAPMTQSFTAHSPLRNTNSAVGIQFFADQIGVDRNTGIYGSYAYRIPMAKMKLSFGITGGVSLVKSNYSNLAVNDNSDNLLVDTPLGILPDCSFGVSLTGKKYFASLSIPFFLSHRFDGNKIIVDHDFNNYNVMLGGGYEFEFGRKKYKLRPSLLLKYNIGNRPQVDINLMAQLHDLFEFGVSFRTEDSVIGLFKFNATKQFAIMYSFGMPITKIGSNQFGSHEIGLRYNFKYQTKIANPRYLGW
ncbi:type IX secretion system membrane protein PorP/SprF [Paracrocinitomix mangrovi]|uniref:PorP/SprF family type IX secretion system membrane protein n=1 Tax=Paracrocinitomix mangrovi TaxID=2862509 RepID=UPI001C8ED769|nr:type IX secretion system membrane protein PorP/SprF [Paracrocinitomix mangrovi]UKN01140.1 type IX secretion system membrane protein PorP/SprF [Paracrocinitomix mangrovi]